MHSGPSTLFSAAAVRELDRRAIEDFGIPGYTLMCRAAEATFIATRQAWPDARRWLVLCGAGNNAGDGYVIARLALARGLDVRVLTLADPARLSGDARRAWQDWEKAGGSVEAYDAGEDLEHSHLVVDALLGIGLDRPLEGDFAEVVRRLNAMGEVPVVSVDIPTGLHADTGEVLGVAIRADLTVTYVGRKQGLYLESGPECCGRLLFDDLDVPSAAVGDLQPEYRLCDPACLRELLPPRPADAHKGHHGHVLLVGGNHGMGGAVRLAGEAALRAGAGLVTVATRPAHVPALLAGRPELMCVGLEQPDELEALVERSSVIALGPGLGQDEWARALFTRVLATDRPLVLDADALNLLARSPARRDNWVLTPHPGEAGRLLRQSTATVQGDRRAALAALTKQFGGVGVLKGRGTLVGRAGEVPWFIQHGNPGMATAGMGDVLTGCVAGLLAQLPEAPEEAAAAAAYAHAWAGDQAARSGQRGLLAGDLAAELRACLNP